MGATVLAMVGCRCPVFHLGEQQVEMGATVPSIVGCRFVCTCAGCVRLRTAVAHSQQPHSWPRWAAS